MGSSVAAIEQEQVEVLHEACARNVPVELHLKNDGTGPIIARARLLMLDDGAIYIDRPQIVGGQVSLKPRQSVMVHLAMGGTRYAFGTRVKRAFCLVRLNAQQRVPGASLEIPTEIQQQQRRADFRLSLAGHNRIVVAMHQGRTDDGGSAPVDAPHFTGWMVNISASGAGIVADRALGKVWKAGTSFFLSFRLPTVEDEFCVLAEFRHYRRIRDDLFILGGFQFVPWAASQPGQHERVITRFIASEQRRHLRRGR